MKKSIHLSVIGPARRDPTAHDTAQPKPGSLFGSATDARDPCVIDTEQGRRHPSARQPRNSPTASSPGEPDGTGVLTSASHTHSTPKARLYWTPWMPAMAHGGSAMAHGGAPANPNGWWPYKTRASTG